MNAIFVAATGQHIGKTTSTLGLAAGLKRRGVNVGYCKPVGQKHIAVGDQMIDKDVALFAQMLKFPIDGKIHSPVIMGKGVTKDYLDNPSDFHYERDILHAASQLKKAYELVIFEGTGHPGVGSIANVSNAEVAKMLGAKVILVVPGGIGNTIDKLMLSLSHFKLHGVPVMGVIINKVMPSKLDQVRYYVGKKLNELGLPLLGVVPFDKRLMYPIMETIKRAVKGRVLYHPEKLDNRVEELVAGSLIDKEDFPGEKNLLLVVSFKRMAEALKKVQQIATAKHIGQNPLSGIIVTGDGRHEQQFEQSEIWNDYIVQHQIPVLTTALDTLGSMVKITKIEVKINTKTPWKTKRAIKLIHDNINFEQVMSTFSIT